MAFKNIARLYNRGLGKIKMKQVRNLDGTDDADTIAANTAAIAANTVSINALTAGLPIVQNIVGVGTASGEVDGGGEVIAFGDDFLAGAQSGGTAPYVNEIGLTSNGPFTASQLFTCPAGPIDVWIRTTDANGGIKVTYTTFSVLDNLNPCGGP